MKPYKNSFWKEEFNSNNTNEYLINILHSIKNFTGKNNKHIIYTSIKERIYYDQKFQCIIAI